MARDSRIVWLDDVTPADWIAPRLHRPGLLDTGSIVPEGFEEYCRIFHPWDDGGGRRRSWSEVAQENGRIVHPEMQAHMIDRPVGQPAPQYEYNNYINEMEWGRLPLPELTALVDILASGTPVDEPCWFCVWDGFGDIEARDAIRRVRLPGRDYLLYTGPIDLALADWGFWDHSPNIWWPESLSWVVVTEIDYAWTYVGGSKHLIEAIVESRQLEALPATLTDKPFHDSDLINAALDGG